MADRIPLLNGFRNEILRYSFFRSSGHRTFLHFLRCGRHTLLPVELDVEIGHVNCDEAHITCSINAEMKISLQDQHNQMHIFIQHNISGILRPLWAHWSLSSAKDKKLICWWVCESSMCPATLRVVFHQRTHLFRLCTYIDLFWRRKLALTSFLLICFPVICGRVERSIAVVHVISKRDICSSPLDNTGSLSPADSTHHSRRPFTVRHHCLDLYAIFEVTATG